MLNKELTYNMPIDPRGKIKYLCKLINIDQTILSSIPEDNACDLLSGVVLYHHLPRQAKSTVLKSIHDAPGPMRSPLVNRVTDPLINPLWGVWSLKTEQLFTQYDFFDSVSTLGSHLGVSFSAAAGVDSVTKLKSGNFKIPTVRNFVVTALVWGFFWNNEGAKNTIQEEIFRRAGKTS